MRERKGSLSVQNSIQTRLSFVMALVMVFVVCINFFIFEQIHTGVDRIDAVFSSNAAINDLSDTLNNLEGTVYEYLNIKGTKALENYYRYEQDYRELLDKLNDRNVDNEVKMLEKNIRRMSESYLNQTSETVQAKRGRNIEKYKASYEKELQLYEYINSYIYKLNNLRFRMNSSNYQLLLSSMDVLYRLALEWGPRAQSNGYSLLHNKIATGFFIIRSCINAVLCLVGKPPFCRDFVIYSLPYLDYASNHRQQQLFSWIFC